MKSRKIWMKVRATLTVVAAVGGLMVTLPGAAQAQTVPIGTVVGIPFREYAPFLIGNITRQKNVNFMHLSQFIAGSGNNAVVTANVNQNNNSQPSPTVFYPAPNGVVNPLYQQININDSPINQTVIGTGNNAVLQANVNQSNHGPMTIGQTRFFQAPVGAVGPTTEANQTNINNSHVQQFVAGSENAAVAMLNVNQSNNLAVAGPVGDVNKLLQININVSPVTQVIIGNNNNAVVNVNVNQQNAPA